MRYRRLDSLTRALPSAVGRATRPTEGEFCKRMHQWGPRKEPRKLRVQERVFLFIPSTIIVNRSMDSCARRTSYLEPRTVDFTNALVGTVSEPSIQESLYSTFLEGFRPYCLHVLPTHEEQQLFHSPPRSMQRHSTISK